MKILLVTALAVGLCPAAEIRLGQPLKLKQPVGIDRILQKPDAYLGQMVQVKGKVTDVCQMMGCWMNLVDPASGASIRIKVKDGEIVFPKDSPGKIAVAEGRLAKVTLTKEEAIAQAKHEAEANGRPFKPESITSGTTYYQIQGTGAVVME